MYLMLKDEESLKIVKNICLKDGFLPTVDDYSPVGEDGLPEIEPGIWFKTEVFSGVLVDCTERVLKWTTNSKSLSLDRSFMTKDRSSVDIGLFTRHMYEGECYDFETGIDDLFDTAASLLEQERARGHRKRKASLLNFHKVITQILHCHILPAIKLKPSDLERVSNVYKQQEKVIQVVNHELEKLSQDIENTKLGIQLKRESMLPELQKVNTVEIYPRDILLLLETQIQGDIDREARSLDKAQEQVNLLKKDKASKELLEKKRKNRDHVFEKQIKLITARENLVQVLQAMAKKNYRKSGGIKWQPVCTRGSTMSQEESIICTRGNKDLANQYVMYMKVNDLLQEQRNKRFILTTKLELILSVRETLREALEDLRQGKESVGFSRDRTKRGRSTDVLRHTNIPEEWLTLTEKVGDILVEGDNPLRKRHCDFVSQIRDKFQAAINVAQVMLDRGMEEANRRKRRQRARSMMHREFLDTLGQKTNPDDEDIKSQTASILRTRATTSRSFRRRLDSIVGMPFEEARSEDDDIQDQIRREISFLSQQIHAHFDLMSSELQVATDQFSDTSYYKTWLCYESHFYCDAMDKIMEMYKLNYRQVCQNLEKNAELVTTDDLGIEERWLKDMFRPVPAESGPSEGENATNLFCWSETPERSKKSKCDDLSLGGVELKTVTKPVDVSDITLADTNQNTSAESIYGAAVDSVGNHVIMNNQSEKSSNWQHLQNNGHDSDSTDTELCKSIEKSQIVEQNEGKDANFQFLNPGYLETDIDFPLDVKDQGQESSNPGVGFINPLFSNSEDDQGLLGEVLVTLRSRSGSFADSDLEQSLGAFSDALFDSKDFTGLNVAEDLSASNDQVSIESELAETAEDRVQENSEVDDQGANGLAAEGNLGEMDSLHIGAENDFGNSHDIYHADVVESDSDHVVGPQVQGQECSSSGAELQGAENTDLNSVKSESSCVDPSVLNGSEVEHVEPEYSAAVSESSDSEVERCKENVIDKNETVAAKKETQNENYVAVIAESEAQNEIVAAENESQNKNVVDKSDTPNEIVADKNETRNVAVDKSETRDEIVAKSENKETVANTNMTNDTGARMKEKEIKPDDPESISQESVDSDDSVEFPGDPKKATMEVTRRKLRQNQSQIFMTTFAPAIACVEAILREYIPLNKLQLMTKCVRMVQKIVMEVQTMSSEQNMMCCDDFLTIIPLILLHCKNTSMSELYPHIIMLMDLMAPFLTNGIHSNSLTHFYGAYQILFSMMVVQTKK